MARTRKKAQEPTAIEAPAEQTPVTEPVAVEAPRVHFQPDGIVHAPAAEPPAPEQPRQPEPEHPAESHHGHAARHHQHREHVHAAHHAPNHERGQPHAESVGKREFKPSPDPFGIAGDYVAGVRLLESKKYREMVLKFEERPSQDVIDKLKDAGYRYNAPSKAWTHGLDQQNAMTVRIDAEKLFSELSGMIRNERGVNHCYGGRS